MPRSRLVLLVWAFGILTLLGAWGHSLFYKSFIRYDKPRAGIRRTVGVVGGSVEIRRVPIDGRGRNIIQFLSLRLKKGSTPPPIPTYKLGRFHSRKSEVRTQHGPDTLEVLEFPIWLPILPWTLLSIPFFLRYRRTEHTHPSELEIPAPGSP